MTEQKNLIIKMIEEINNKYWIGMIFGFVSGFYEAMQEKGGAK